jgi:hypothetical protein
MSGTPIRKHELTALESLGRGQAGAAIDDPTMQRLLGMGLIEQTRLGWRITKRGTLDLQRRKSLQRSSS